MQPREQVGHTHVSTGARNKSALHPPSAPVEDPASNNGASAAELADAYVGAPESQITSIIEQHPTRPPFTISHEWSITGDQAEALWEAYRVNFEPLAKLAILQHFFTREEILAELANPRILKIVGWQEGAPVGLGLVTNSLVDVPQISPAFLVERYPEHAARNAIYYGILVMVAQTVRGRTLFARLYTEMWQVPALVGGVLVFDICDFNRVMFDADTLAQKIADNFPHSSMQVLDRQTYYVAELPEPIPAKL
jgi:hypothetical protein